MNIFDAIADGLHDDDLDAIISAAKARQKSIPLVVGDWVVVNDNCSPKYMQGVKGQIKSLTKVKKGGEPVYLVRVLDEEQWKLSRTKMMRYVNGEYKCADINMQRTLISKVTST